MAADFEEKELIKPEKYDSWFNPQQTKLEAQSNKLFEIKGFPYPVNRSDPRGFFYQATNYDVIKADLLQLLLTEPGERVMLPAFGTGLRRMIFEQKDSTSADQLRTLILDAIELWEPRIVVHEVNVKFGDSGRDPRNLPGSNVEDIVTHNKQDPHDNRVMVPGDNVDTNSFVIRIVYALKENLEGIENLEFRINYEEPILN